MGFIERMVEAMKPAAAQATQAQLQATDKETATQSSTEPKQAGRTESPEETAADQDEAPEGKSYSEGDIEAIIAERKKTWEIERMSSLSKDSQIEELKAEIQKRDLKEKIVSKLEEAKLPLGVADLVQYSDEAGTMENLEKVITTINQLVQDGITMRLRGRTPEGLGNAANASMTDPFAKAFTDAMQGITKNKQN